MADNVAITPGSGTTIASDDVGGVQHQRVKISQGADGSATDVSSAAPLQVTLANTGANTNKLLVTPDLPSGASSSAKQDTANTSLSSIDGKITAVNTGAVVISSSALPSGAATAAKQPALGTAGTASSDVITVQGKAAMTPLLVDGSATTQPVSGTVTVNSHAVTNAGTFVVQENGAALTALSLIDDPIATLGTTTYTETTTKGNIVGAVRRDADTTLVDTTNEIAPLQVNAAGQLKVALITALPAGSAAIGKLSANDGVDIGDATINNASGGSAVNVQDGGNSLTVDYATTGSGTATGALRVELPTNGTGVLATVGAVTSITNSVTTTSVGTIADDATTPGAPVMIGGQAKESDGTDPSSVSAEDDVVRAIFDRNRRQYVSIVHPNLWTANDNQSSAQTNTSLKSAPGANLSLYITDIIISNGATAGDVRFVEDPAGTPVIKIPKVYVAINGGAVMHFITPIRITANKAFGYTSTTVTTHSVMVNGYTAP